MLIGERLRELREAKKLSQGDIEERTGLIRCYTSRVENGHTVPSLETIEKYAHALDLPLYQIFYEGRKPPRLPKFPEEGSEGRSSWGSRGRDARMLGQFYSLLRRMNERDRKLLLTMALIMARRVRRRQKS